ncbi:MAG: serine/threonine-protein phosphatase [Myxococcales bacterium]|nr:serine/threonine-protein phosphatase [Myxococcales bacterium]
MAIASGHTDVGGRDYNEDSFCIEPSLGLYAVSDGMGGYEGGEIASRLVVSALVQYFDEAPAEAIDGSLDATVAELPERLVSGAVRLAHNRITEHALGSLSRMGATVAVLWLHERETIIAHVGDSRVYRLRDGVLCPLTTDHVVEEDDVVFLTRSISGFSDWRPELRREPVAPGDTFLLCSDGLTEALSESDIARVLQTYTPTEAPYILIEMARLAGAADNVTAVVVRVTEPKPAN